MKNKELMITFPENWCNKYDIFDLRVIITSRPEKTESGYKVTAKLDDKIFRGTIIDELYDRIPNSISLSEWKTS
jgi:hypothetical protein